jgi:hypothetical protein
VTVEAGRLLIVGIPEAQFRTGILSQANPGSTGSAGPIRVTATEIVLADDGRVSSRALGQGSAGPISLTVADSLAIRSGSITSSAVASGGGQITLQVGDVLDIEGGTIESSVFGGVDTTAGDITIDPRFIILDGGRIVARATEGQGGNIRIAADNLIASPDSTIDASAESGIDGTVVVSTPEANLVSGLVVLEGAFVDLARLPERCAARRDVGASSFTGTGHGGLPPSPETPLTGAFLAEPGGPALAPAGFASGCGAR